jgi:hypothetical protein
MERLLEEYSGNYVQFLTTGIPDYERAYKNAQTAIEKLLEDKRQQVDKEKRDMKHFAETYTKDNQDLSKLIDSASEMYENAQDIQDKFETSKQRYSEFTSDRSSTTSNKPVDVSNGYKLLFRIGLILILLPILFVFGYYIITDTSSYTTPGLPSITITSPTLGAMSP